MNHLRPILLCCLVGALLAPAVSMANDPPRPGLDAVKAIYVMPMKNRMDHYLTAELVKWGHYQVTLNPQQADAILSDVPQIDVKGLLQDPSKVTWASRASRGNSFLIDPKSEKVIWSASKDPSTSYLVYTEYKSVKDLAHEIIGQLKKDTGKQK
jgi:hypothetical protein